LQISGLYLYLEKLELGEDVNLDMEDLKVFIRLYLEKLELEEGLKLKSRRSQVCILNRKKVKLEKV